MNSNVILMLGIIFGLCTLVVTTLWALGTVKKDLKSIRDYLGLNKLDEKNNERCHTNKA